MKREDNRKTDELRETKITRNFLKYPEGSVFIEIGETKIVCTATVEEAVPHHRKGSGKGWVTAEYAMLPRATPARTPREIHHRAPRGRTHEIQRLIGRSLRAVTDMDILGERTILIDTDVLQADGGTRTAAITGAFVALYDAMNHLLREGKINRMPIKEFLAAVSVGRVSGENIIDLKYSEDSTAEVDMNIVMTESGKFIEVQGTAESKPFERKELDDLLSLAKKGIDKLIKLQREALGL